MKKQNILPVLVMSVLIFGCAAPEGPTLPVASPTTALPTLTFTPTSPRPTATVTGTATEKPTTPTRMPEPSQQTSSDFFAYFQEVRGIRRLVFMNANGRERKVMELPKAINNSFAPQKPFDLDVRLVSPDGHWLAFYTGSAGDYGNMPAQGTSDLTLNLLDLMTGEEQIITPLLSKEYPNNFAQAADKITDPDITAESLYDAFVNGITEAFAWSPDGRYLAFAGQMDGLSSDLYVYDVTKKDIRRLSSGDQELQWIEWSPDGKRILHSSVFSVGVGMTFDIYAASLDSSSVPYLSTNILYDGIEHWLNSHQYFENDGENVAGLYGLRLVDIDTGKITKLWEETFYSYAVDQSGKWVAIIDSPDAPTGENNSEFELDFVPAIYLINLATLEQLRVDTLNNHTFENVTSFGLGSQEFAVTERDSSSRNANMVFLSTNGTLTQTDLGDVAISISPNSDYWLAIRTITNSTNQNFVAVTDQKLEIFSADNTLIKEIPFFPLHNSTIYDLTWRPDSSGVFLLSGTKIFSMNVPSGDIKVVESSLMNDNYKQAYGWINGQ